MVQREISTKSYSFPEIFSNHPTRLTQNSISQILHKYDPLLYIPNSTNYRIKCPLHNSSNPTTFHVTDDCLFYCFACHKGGNVIELYSQLYKVSRRDSITQLCKNGMGFGGAYEYSRLANETRRRIESYSKSNDEKVFIRYLEPEMSHGCEISVLENDTRGVNSSAISHFSLSGIRRNKIQVGVYIPFLNHDGGYVGYSIRNSKRSVPDDLTQKGTGLTHESSGLMPKYIHSKGLKKSELLYGFYENKNAIRESREIYLVEGVFDCIALFSLGILNSASILGSSVSINQMRLLLPYVNKVHLLFDGDEAGREGMKKAYMIWKRVFDVDMIHLPDNEDPDSMNKKELINLIEKANRRSNND